MRNSVVGPYMLGMLLIGIMVGGIAFSILTEFVDLGVKLMEVDHLWAAWFLIVSGLVMVAKRFGYWECSQCGHPTFHPGKDGDYAPRSTFWPQRYCGNCGHDLTLPFEFK